jgi:hypothetical protein
MTEVGEQQALTIICSSRVDLTTSLQQSKGNTHVRYISALQVKKNKEYSVDHGIEIDDLLWVEINRIGAGILVKNTEVSRQGAGGR